MLEQIRSRLILKIFARNFYKTKDNAYNLRIRDEIVNPSITCISQLSTGKKLSQI